MKRNKQENYVFTSHFKEIIMDENDILNFRRRGFVLIKRYLLEKMKNQLEYITKYSHYDVTMPNHE